MPRDISAEAPGIALDSDANCYITGYYTRNATFGSTVLENINSSNDIFVAKLDSGGNWILALRTGGANSEIAQSIEVSPSGSCFITGAYYAATSFGTHNLASYGGSNFEIFVAALGVVPPLEPENLVISRVGNDIHLQWDAVTENTLGTDITPDHYNVYYTLLPYPDAPATFVESVSGTAFTHQGAASEAGKRFYHVTAVLQ